jgi:hypothetical protein
MNLGLHPIAQGGIDQLVPSDEPLAFEERADDDRLEMMTVAIDFEVVAGQSRLDVTFYVLWSHHAAILGGIGQNASKGLFQAGTGQE